MKVEPLLVLYEALFDGPGLLGRPEDVDVAKHSATATNTPIRCLCSKTAFVNWIWALPLF